MNRAKAIRQQIRERLRPVAKPDSRFHMDFANVIPDFLGSEQAIQRLIAQPLYRESNYAFVTPDNGLADLRRRMLDDGKTLVVSTYGVHRGFVLLEPSRIARDQTPKGIKWQLLEPEQLAATPPLQELQRTQERTSEV